MDDSFGLMDAWMNEWIIQIYGWMNERMNHLDGQMNNE